MQLSLTYKRCSCEKCNSAKNCLTLNAKSINDKGSQQMGQSVRHRTFSRARPSRPRARHSYGNQQHRLDHTYAAAEVTSVPVEAPAATMSSGLLHPYSIERFCKIVDDPDIIWSPKDVDLHQCRQRSRLKVTHDEADKENKLPTPNGKLKHFQKIQEDSISIQEKHALKLINEERNRWIAASALLDLSRRIVKFSDQDK